MKKLFLILPFCFLFACEQSEKENLPANLLNKTEMTQILIDIHLTEALIELNIHQIDSARAFYKIKEKEIFEKHQVDEKIFRTSYDYYMNHEKELDKIYEVVIDSLNMRSVKAQAN